MPAIFSNIYHEDVGIGGLHYIALGVGLTGASQLNARFMDRIYVHFKNKNNGVGEPEFRLRMFTVFPHYLITNLHSSASMLPGTFLLPFGLLLTGWSAQHHLHWIATDIVCINFGHSLFSAY